MAETGNTEERDQSSTTGSQDSHDQQTNRDADSESTPTEISGFRILRLIGRGGMGEVFEAIQTGLDRRVAVKVLSRRLNSNRVGERFQREAKATASLNHPNIVSAFDYGIENGRAWLAMPLVEGVSLETLIAAMDEEKRSSLPRQQREQADALIPKEAERFDWIANIGVQLSSALAYAHSRGIVHRDIKPANLLIGLDGNLAVTDFGISKVMDDDSKLTQTGDIVGTPRYMAPEQACGSVDFRSDLYAAGLTLRELVTGRQAYAPGDGVRVGKSAGTFQLAPLRSIAANAPVGLARMIDRCCSFSPDDRYPNANELHDLFKRFSETGVGERRRVQRSDNRVSCFRRRRLIAASALLAIGLLALLYMRPITSDQVTLSEVTREVKVTKELEPSTDLESTSDWEMKAFRQELWPQPDGSVRVREELTLSFHGHYSSFTRYFASDKIGDVRVSDDVLGEYRNRQSNAIGTFTWSQADDVQEIKWLFDVTDGTRTFVLQYVLSEEIVRHGELAVWNQVVLGARWNKAVESIDVRIHPLPEHPLEQARVWFNGSADLARIANGLITSSIRQCSKGETIEGCIVYPAEAVPMAPESEYALSVVDVQHELAQRRNVPLVNFPLDVPGEPVRLVMKENTRSLGKFFVFEGWSLNFDIPDDLLQMEDDVVSFQDPVDHETTPEIVLLLTGTDNEGKTAKERIVVTVENVDEPPYFEMDESRTVIIDENGFAKLPVATDPEGSTVTYEIGASKDGDRFSHDRSSNRLRFNEVENDETANDGPFEVVLIASDGRLTSEVTLSIGRE